MTPEPQPRPDSGATKALTVRPREIAFTRFRVEVLAGPDKGLTLVAEAPELTIGGAPGNHLVLSDRTVSRHHCTISATPRGFLLRDLGSTNGTTVAGLRIEAAYLDEAAVLGVGESSLRFEILDDEIREPLGEEAQQGELLGQSPAMRRVFAMLPRIAASDSTVLLEGETGTGKGLLAGIIHQRSPRAAGPFVVIDCAAIPPTLIESELFGHARGAFTGAVAARAGAFEAARGGTVLLDEIGELRLDLQPKLLRALEERSIRRIGSLDPVRLDVRVIAATNRDLRLEVNRGNFRSDLYYRLNIVHVRVPPLRERREDIPLLAAHFYRQFAPDAPHPPAELLEELLRQDWPGNVRELRGTVERAVLLGDPAFWRDGSLGELLQADAAPEPRSAPVAPVEKRRNGSSRPPSDGAPGPSARVPSPDDLTIPFREAKERAVAHWERAYLDALMRTHGGNLSRAARAVRMDRNHLRELLHRHGLTASLPPPSPPAPGVG